MPPQLSTQQRLYSELVAGGMDEREAVLKAGYMEKNVRQMLYKLRKDKRVLARIDALKRADENDAVMSKQEMLEHWTSIIRDPSISINQKTENSKLLAKALGMFIDRRQVNAEVKTQAVMIIPEVGDWEKYWEDINGQ